LTENGVDISVWFFDSSGLGNMLAVMIIYIKMIKMNEMWVVFVVLAAFFSARFSLLVFHING
jgi:hypothetical protein